MLKIQEDAAAPVAVQTLRFNGQRYVLSAVFEPLRSPEGQLVAVELLSRFTAVYADAPALPPARFYAQAPPLQLRKALRAQVSDLRRCLPWLQARGVRVSLNVNRALARLIVQDSRVFADLAGLQPWLRLEISEHFLQPEEGAGEDRLLASLAALAPLWLDDFGTGSAGLSALLSRRFEALKLDAGVFATLSGSDDGRALVVGLNKVAQACGTAVIAEGVESAAQWLCVSQTGLWAAQGWRWPGVSAAALDSLAAQDDGIQGGGMSQQQSGSVTT